MEYKIREIFEYNGEWYQCVVGNRCRECDFSSNNVTCDINGALICTCKGRSDGTSVIFKRREKVGEPITVKGRTFQKLTSDNNSCKECVFNAPNKACCKNSYIEGICDDNGFWVEIKQTKEDMNGNNRTNCAQCGDKRFEVIARAKAHLLEATNIASDEKEMAVIDNILFRFYQMGWLERYEEETEKLDLKPFDLEAAKAGKPVCTRDGRKARIICFDTKGDVCPIIALIEENGIEVTIHYDRGGRNCYKGSNDDLMMLPEKKEGWAVIRRSDIYETEEAAKRKLLDSHTAVMVKKITWEE